MDKLIQVKKVFTLHLKGFWQHLGTTQSDTFRLLHISLAGLVLLQIIDSNFMHVNYKYQWSINLGAYIHIYLGFLTFIVSFLVIVMALLKRGFRYYYPYFYNDHHAVLEDLKHLKRFKLPTARSGSIAAIVQGLGLGALVLVLSSGLYWLLCYFFELSIAHDIQGWHKTLTGLIEFYIYGHGAVGILHFILEKYYPDRIALS